MANLIDYIVADLQDERVKKLARMIDSMTKNGKKLFEVVPHYSGSSFYSYDENGKKRTAYSETSFGVKINIPGTSDYDAFASVYTEKFSPKKYGKAVIRALLLKTDTEEGKRFFTNLINASEVGFGPDNDKLPSLLSAVQDSWDRDLCEECQKMLGIKEV